jgi:signal peptidase I
MEKVKPRSGFLSKIIKVFLIIWLLCIVLFTITFAIATNWFREVIQSTDFGNSKLFIYSSLGTFIAGVLSFGFAILGFLITEIRHRKEQIFKRGVIGIIFYLLGLLSTMLFLPLILIYRVSGTGNLIRKVRRDGFKFSYLKPKKLSPFLGRLGEIFFIALILLPVWVGGYLVSGAVIANQLGYVSEETNIVGTGSMYPTWPKGTKGKDPNELAKEIITTAGFLPYPNGIVISGKRFFGHILDRGDIIIWRNDKTFELTSKDGGTPSGLLKRLIGLPGDTIEIKDGILYLNGEPQKEPYIAKARSTFAEKFLKECSVITVPPDEVFAMGDNRKGSADSREIGFVPIKDIDHVLPLSKQKGKLDNNWHDATNDLTDSAKPRIDKDKFVELLNEKRKVDGASLLKYDSLLEKSAALRGEAVLKYDDFEQKGPYSMEKSMADAGYWNSYWWEVTIQGYYEAEELIEDYLERDWTDSKDTWFDEKFDDIGIAEVAGTLNGCPTQVILIHIAGYVPPNYKQEDIEGWRSILNRLREIQPSWSVLTTNKYYYAKYPTEVDRINEIISIRISNIEGIVAQMDSNQWLTQSQTDYTHKDTDLYNEQENLANFLNSHN